MGTTFAKALTGLALLAAGIGSAYAQGDAGQYPTRRIAIVAAGPGGSIDFGARLVAQGLSMSLNQPAVVENRPSGVIPNQLVAKAAPDGYTLLFSGGNLWVTQLFENNLPYDPFRDFTPISLVQSVPQVLLVHPVVPAKSIKELIALAKAQPGKLNFATAAPGSIGTLATAMFAYMANIKIQQIPYKNTTSRMAGFLAGETEVHIATAAGALPFLKTGRVRALGVTTEKPTPLLPGVPTIAATIPGYQSASAAALFAPAKTPTAIVNRLALEVASYVKRPETQEKFMTAGMEPVGSSPDVLAKYMKSEADRMAKLIKATGLKATPE